MMPAGSIELLAVTTVPASLAGLATALGEQEIPIDLVSDLRGARRSFLHRGGHRMLLLAPDLAPATALRITQSLLAVDPTVRVVVFGRELLRQQGDRVFRRLASYHPSSRAGIGAVLRVVKELIG
jgi:hypothetical protein